MTFSHTESEPGLGFSHVFCIKCHQNAPILGVPRRTVVTLHLSYSPKPRVFWSASTLSSSCTDFRRLEMCISQALLQSHHCKHLFSQQFLDSLLLLQSHVSHLIKIKSPTGVFVSFVTLALCPKSIFKFRQHSPFVLLVEHPADRWTNPS